jgi:hypothetical protein
MGIESEFLLVGTSSELDNKTLYPIFTLAGFTMLCYQYFTLHYIKLEKIPS